MIDVRAVAYRPLRLGSFAALALVDLALAVSAQPVREGQAPTPWRQQNAARAAAEEADAAKARGQVYKNTDFWRRFVAPETMRGIFKGDAQWGQNNLFYSYFMSFNTMFSARCAASLPANSTRFSVETITTRYGIRRTTDVRSWIVDPAFAASFEKYSTTTDPNAAALFYDAVLEIAGAKANTGAAKVRLTPVADMALWFDTVGCDSAAMSQFKQNLLRLELRQPSLAESGIAVPNAAKESDSPN